VAQRAVRRESARNMIRIGGGVQIRLVAADASRRSPRKSPANVAGSARQRGVNSRQGKVSDRRMIELRA